MSLGKKHELSISWDIIRIAGRTLMKQTSGRRRLHCVLDWRLTINAESISIALRHHIYNTHPSLQTLTMSKKTVWVWRLFICNIWLYLSRHCWEPFMRSYSKPCITHAARIRKDDGYVKPRFAHFKAAQLCKSLTWFTQLNYDLSIKTWSELQFWHVAVQIDSLGPSDAYIWGSKQ